MVALILFILFGLIFGYFATLNTSLVSVHFGSYILQSVPMYVVVLVSLGLGVVFASLFYLVKSFSVGMMLKKKEESVIDAAKEVAELTKKNHQLELENTRLKTKTGETADDEESI
jgi:uncharacterized membrane protein (DUF106 family)